MIVDCYGFGLLASSTKAACRVIQSIKDPQTVWLLTDGLMHAAVFVGPVFKFAMENDSHLSNSVLCYINF